MDTSPITVLSLGPKGDGIHLGKTGTVYVERAAPGDSLKARFFEDVNGILRAEIVEILEPSPHRQPAQCRHYDQCGGCTVQHLESGFYRDWKSATVKAAFAKYDLSPQRWLPPVYIGTHNRRRATFSAAKAGSSVVMGYYRRRSAVITDIEICPISDPKLLELRQKILPALPSLLTDKPLDIFVQILDSSIDLVFTGPIGRNGWPDQIVTDTLRSIMDGSKITRISWRPDTRDRITTLLNRGQVAAQFGPLTVVLPPAAFLQPTTDGEKALVKAVMEALPSEGKFADLFSGCGTFSGPMLMNGEVDAYESDPLAVKALSRSGSGLPLAVFRRDLFIDPIYRNALNRYDGLVFDPPRQGMPEQSVELAASKVPVLIGVSCNPATLSRDAAILCDGGYRLESLQVIDQFLWSHHVEMVAVFSKKLRHGRAR